MTKFNIVTCMTKVIFYVVESHTMLTPHTTDIECTQCWIALQLVYNSLLYILESGVNLTYYLLMVMLCYSGLCFVSVLLVSKEPKKYELHRQIRVECVVVVFS